MAGVPLVGKTTLARHLVDELGVQVLHVENDRLRALVVEAMGRRQPAFDAEENHATYRAARQLIERGLQAGLHVVHDATNLTESTRKQAYPIADALEAPTRVIFVQAPEQTLERRASQEGPAARQALEALGDRRPEPTEGTRPHIVLDGLRDPQTSVRDLLAEDSFATLREPA